MMRERETGGEISPLDMHLRVGGETEWMKSYRSWYARTHDRMEPPAVTPKSFQAAEVHVGYTFGVPQAKSLVGVVRLLSDMTGSDLEVEVSSSGAATRITKNTQASGLFEKKHPFTNGVKVTVKVEGPKDAEKRAKAAWTIANVLGDSRIDKALRDSTGGVKGKSPELDEMLGKLA